MMHSLGLENIQICDGGIALSWVASQKFKVQEKECLLNHSNLIHFVDCCSFRINQQGTPLFKLIHTQETPSLMTGHNMALLVGKGQT